MRVTTITYFGTNFFFLEVTNGYMLIDAGWTGQWDRFLREIKTVGISLKEIHYVFVTHLRCGQSSEDSPAFSDAQRPKMHWLAGSQNLAGTLDAYWKTGYNAKYDMC
ncbi:MAG: MBL fold metallo-hydrolase [Thermoguttaceae bacterium]